jgi:hypothetical protein
VLAVVSPWVWPQKSCRNSGDAVPVLPQQVRYIVDFSPSIASPRADGGVAISAFIPMKSAAKV